MANDRLNSKTLIKVINNTTGLLSFMGIDGRKYSFNRAGAFRMVELGILEGLFNEHENFITHGYIYLADKRAYDYLGIPVEVYSKIKTLKELDEMLEKDADELKEELKELPNPMKENIAIIAKSKGIDSKKKIKAIKEVTGFDVEQDDEE